MEAQQGADIWVAFYVVMLLILLTSMIMILATFLYKRRLWEQELKRQETEYEKKTLERIIATIDAEKERFAANLHDSLGGDLTVLLLEISDSDQIELETKQQLTVMVQELIQRVRQISHDLMPPTLKRLGLKPTLGRLCEQFNKQEQFDLHYDWAGNNNRLDSNVELNIYRITKELLNNALKHAQAKNVWVSIKHDTQSFYLEVRDDGIGYIEQGEEAGNGLTNMRMRAKLIGGTLEFIPKQGVGLTTQLFLHKPK